MGISLQPTHLLIISLLVCLFVAIPWILFILEKRKTTTRVDTIPVVAADEAGFNEDTTDETALNIEVEKLRSGNQQEIITELLEKSVNMKKEDFQSPRYGTVNEYYSSEEIQQEEDQEALLNFVEKVLETDYPDITVKAEAFEHFSRDIVKKIIFSETRSGITEIDTNVIGATNDEGIDSYIVQKDPYSPNFGITLIQSKWHYFLKEPASTLQSDNADPITKLNRIASFIFNDAEPIGNTEVKKLFSIWRDINTKVKELNDDDKHDLVPPDPCIYLVLACQKYSSQKDNLIIKQLYKSSVVNLKDFKRVYEDDDGNAPEVPTVFAKIKLDQVMKISNQRTDYIGSISGHDFCKMYNKGTSDNRIKHSQFLYSNVRNRLSETGDKTANEILDQVKNTIDNEPQEFFSRNNGFTLVVDKVQRIEKSDSWYWLQTPQLVNGGQTANALWEYYELRNNEEQKLKSVRVPIKVVEINMTAGDRQDLCRRVAYASNHQNQVDKRDLYGIGKWIDTLKVWLEKSQDDQCRRGEPIFYAIKKGQWEEIKDDSTKYRSGSGNAGGTPRFFDNAVIAQYMWATFFGGAIASAKRVEQWSEEMADRLHFRKKDKNYPSGNSLVEQENIWYRNETNHDFLSEALFVKLLHDEVKESQNRKTLLRKKEYLASLNINQDLKTKINWWMDPITKRVTFMMLIINQALRIRCNEDLDLRRKMLNFFIGDTINAADTVHEQKIFHVFKGDNSYHSQIWEEEGPFGCISRVNADIVDSNALNAIYSKVDNKNSHSHALLLLFDICRKIAVRARAELITSGDLPQETTDIRKQSYITRIIEKLEQDQRLKYLNLGVDCKSTEIISFEKIARELAVIVKRTP